MLVSLGNTKLTVGPHGELSYFATEKNIWNGGGPLLLLHYYDRQHPRKQVVAAPSQGGNPFGTAGTPSLAASGMLSVKTQTDTGCLLEANFESIHIRICIELRLLPDKSGFYIRIPENGTEEGMPRLYRVLGIELLPDFGAACTGEEGYLTLPNWSGCQTFFDKSYPREVWQTIYSSNDQWEYVSNMALFGISRSQGTLCGIITQGEYDAQLVCRLHWEKDQINCVHPYLVYRWEQQDEVIAGAREIRYSFAPKDYENGEGYAFCAKSYREFLKQEGCLPSWDQKAKDRPAVLDYRDRLFLKIFMAYKEPQPDGRGAYHSTCTFEEVRSILEECKRRGVTRLMAILVGWGQDGHDGMPPTRFPVDERLGGEKSFKTLIEWCQKEAILLGVHDSYGGYYSCSPEFNASDLIRHRTGEYWESIIWSGGQCHIACPTIYIEKHVNRDVPAVRRLGLYGHHHIDAVGSFMPCFSEEHPLKQRKDFCAKVREMFEYVGRTMGSVSTELPFGPYFGVIDGLFHSYSRPSPWHRDSELGRYFLDRSIPLLPLVLHGSVNCYESIQTFGEEPLHWLDWGLCPQWEVCKRASEAFGIPSFDSVADKISDIYQMYFGDKSPYLKLNRQEIEGRWELAPGLTQTLYADGTLVRVNLNDTAYKEIASKSYEVISPETKVSLS